MAPLLLGAAAGSAPEPLSRAWIPYLPAPVDSDAGRLIAFEVVAAFSTTEPVVLRRVSVNEPASRETLADYSGSDLANRIVIEGKGKAPAFKAPTYRVRIYVEAAVSLGKKPHALVAKISYTSAEGSIHEIQSPITKVEPIPPVVLGPPLTGGTWVAVHDPGWSRGHRRVVYDTHGLKRIPGRYAIDWVGVRDDGGITDGDPDRPADAVGYGVAVLAGADGMVAEIRAGMAESASIKGNPAQLPGDGSGNFVSLRIGPRRYAIYEHLKPGSIVVKPGQRVRTGEVIGALGFTGDSTGPHLHLHVADCAAPIACEGVPFVVRGMTELGRYADLQELGKRRWRDEQARGRLKPEWPGYNVVVSFDEVAKRGAGNAWAASADRHRSRCPVRPADFKHQP